MKLCPKCKKKGFYERAITLERGIISGYEYYCKYCKYNVKRNDYILKVRGDE